MSDNLKKNLWLVGCGQMACDYAKVLLELNVDFTSIGRGQSSSDIFYKKTGIQPFIGGLNKFLDTKPKLSTHAIVSVGIIDLAELTINLIDYGVKNILIEKPGGLNQKEIENILNKSIEKDCKVFIGYNRRFYASTIKAIELINIDGGVKSFHFEFTEWSHEIKNININKEVKSKWFLANSTHVLDLAFFLGGFPKIIKAFSGSGFDWHPSGSIFTGSGISESGALFSYHANWSSAGRWGLEILTDKRRLIFKPIERLQIQNIGSLDVEFEDIDYQLDERFKPGLFLQVSNFIKNEFRNMIDIKTQFRMIDYYYKISNY